MMDTYFYMSAIKPEIAYSTEGLNFFHYGKLNALNKFCIIYM